MRQTQITTADLGLIAGTRVALGVGVGLLLAGVMPDRERRGVGLTLFAVGALTTIPLVMKVFGWPRTFALVNGSEKSAHQPHHDFQECRNERGFMPVS